MVIYLIGKAGKTGFIGPNHCFELNAAAVWHDQPIPDDLRPFLRKTNVGVVSTQNTSALRNQKVDCR